jgi:sulfide dehydrogenase cytochrome subunit
MAVRRTPLSFLGAQWRRQIFALAITATLAGLGADRSSAQDIDRGAQLAAACASCHRLDGAGMGIPTIIGLGEQKLTSALLAYRVSESPNHIMHAIALSLSDEEIASVARYVAAQGK